MKSRIRFTVLVVAVVGVSAVPGAARANWIGDAWGATTGGLGDAWDASTGGVASVVGATSDGLQVAGSYAGRGVVAAGRWTWEHRADVLAVAVPVGCLIVTNGAGSYLCIAAGAAIMGAENAATQLATTGTIAPWALFLATGGGAVSGAFGTPIFGVPLRAGATLLTGAPRTGSVLGNLALSRGLNTAGWAGVRTAGGGVRNANRFWAEQLMRHGRDFSPANRALIAKGLSPVLDGRYAAFNPQFMPRFVQNALASRPAEVLLHHHVQGGAVAIPMPAGMHAATGTFCVMHGFAPNCM